MTTLLYRPTRRQRGFTLVEVGIAAVLMAMLMGGALLFIADYLRGQYAQAQGQALFTFNTAVNAYEQKYTPNLANHTAIAVPGYANVANIYAPTATELFHLGFLTNATPDSTYGVKINTALTNGAPVGLSWLTTPFRNLQGSLDQALAGEAMQAAGGDAA
jgi:prepilin-type N-terminal cleavage/methylation domain-containing protein